MGWLGGHSGQLGKIVMSRVMSIFFKRLILSQKKPAQYYYGNESDDNFS
ncbi:MAG: hypothetical protein OJF59_001009 [Cytophagales bacterium]|jgi:hypothetical protein|nr:MAG: hypothetical protein OJF59_001009 [Cytophagales bacterium]